MEAPKGTKPVAAAVPESPKLLDPPVIQVTESPNGTAPKTVPLNVASETEIPPGLVSKENKVAASFPLSPKSNIPSNASSITSTICQATFTHITHPVPLAPPLNDVHIPNKEPNQSSPELSAPSPTKSDVEMRSPPASPSPPPHRTPLLAPPPIQNSKVSSQPPNENAAPVLEIQQPKPLYGSPTASKDMEMVIDIPPTTHSPPNEDSPPDSPAVVTPPSAFATPYPTIDEIPSITQAQTKEEAFRIVVMSRLLADRLTREERVNPVLMTNLSISTPLEVHPTATPDSLLEWMFNTNEQGMKDRIDSYIKTRPMLSMYLEKRHNMVKDKATRLREEYLALQEKWIAHCHSLNEQQKTLASEHEMQHTGRTTRRTTAFTDAVRSDFEMEQIIASLGVDDATDPNHLSMRNLAKIPDMISVTKGQVDYLFDDTSHLIDNPKEYYAPHTGIQDWKDDEKAIFLDKFAAHPKQFGIIADYLPNKTAAQCVDYYYLHKNKFIDFRKVVSQLAPNKRRRRGMGKKKGNGLLVDIAIHDMEVNRGGVANGTSASAPVKRAARGRKAAAATLEARAALARRTGVQFDTPTTTPTPEPESAPPTRGRRRKTAAPTSTNLTHTTTASASATPSRVPTPSMPPPSAPPSAAPSAPPSAPPSAAPTPVMSAPPVPLARKPPPPSPSPIRQTELAVSFLSCGS